MCLGIPGRIVEIPDRQGGLATVDISGVRRSISVALVGKTTTTTKKSEQGIPPPSLPPARIDEEQAQETLDLLRRGVELQQELDEIRHGTVA